MKVHCILPICLVALLAVASANEVSSGINSFANKLYNVLPKKNTNLVFSPMSAHAALSLTYQGAADETARSFQRSLNVPEVDATASGYKSVLNALASSGSVQIQVANKIYVKSGYKLKDRFRTVAQNYFSADAQSVDFVQAGQAADEINAWVKEKTNEKIDKLVSAEDFDRDTRAVLLNAIYFKGNWLKQFPVRTTRSDKFYTSETDSVDCKMMSNLNDFEYGEDQDLDSKILKMKYQDERFTMVVVLPNSINGLEELEKKLVDRDVSSLSTSMRKVIVSFPKFKFETTLKLKEPLKQIGLSEIFSNNADFSNMLDTKEKITVDKVIQKAYIEVNEEGSEAASSTGVVMKWRTSAQHPHSPKIFKANHPFIFYITANVGSEVESSSVLFMGKIVAPN